MLPACCLMGSDEIDVNGIIFKVLFGPPLFLKKIHVNIFLTKILS